MFELNRTVRFCLNGPGDARAESSRSNSFSAWPAMRGLGRYYELHVLCFGEADPVTGYLVNIKHIDTAVRDHVLPWFGHCLESTPRPADVPMGELMRQSLTRLKPHVAPHIEHLRLHLTPYHSLELRSRDMSHLIIRQQYEFSAAHRLHVPALSDAENRNVFGKCNNPSGHGHNYKLEVAVRAPIDEAGRVLLVEQLDELVDRVIIERLDHKHLNADVPEFAELNPSVEHIVRVIYQWLVEPVQQLGVTLDACSVWETGKTVCTYRGAEAAV